MVSFLSCNTVSQMHTVFRVDAVAGSPEGNRLRISTKMKKALGASIFKILFLAKTQAVHAGRSPGLIPMPQPNRSAFHRMDRALRFANEMNPPALFLPKTSPSTRKYFFV